MTDIRTDPVTDRSAWHRRDVEADRSWEHELTAPHHQELAQALAAIGDAPMAQMDVNAFQRPALTELMGRVSQELQQGRGFALLHGFPVESYDEADVERLYWGLASHIGTAVTQNSAGTLVHYVTDGRRRPEQGSRGVGRPGPVGLHIDLTDCASLLCARQAPDDPPSRLASAMHVYNEILHRRPDALPRLYEGFEWDRQDEHGEGESPTSGYPVPVFSQRDGVVSCRYNRGWIGKARQRLEQPLTHEETQIFDLMGEISAASCLEFPFHTGDIQFANNFTVLHGRAGHEEVPDEDRKRVLLRLWLDFPECRPVLDEALIRYGLVRHGQLGWTAQDLLAQKHLQPRARRPDGVPII